MKKRNSNGRLLSSGWCRSSHTNQPQPTITSRTRQNAVAAGGGAPAPSSMALTTNLNAAKAGAPNKATARSVPAFLNKLYSCVLHLLDLVRGGGWRWIGGRRWARGGDSGHGHRAGARTGRERRSDRSEDEAAPDERPGGIAVPSTARGAPPRSLR